MEVKKIVSRDLLLLVFFVNHLPSDNNARVIYEFFSKIAEIFASQGSPSVSTTPAAGINDTGSATSTSSQ